MASDQRPTSSTPASAPVATPALKPPATSWGAQHFDRAPSAADIRAMDARQQQDQLAENPPPGAQQKESSQGPQGTPSITEAVKSIRAQDFLQVYQIPCARQGFLTGIGGGAVVGMLRYIAGGHITRATNWAVGAFAAGGIVAFEVCQAARRAERARMRRVVEVYDRKHQAEAAAAAEARQKREAEAKRCQREEAERARRPWYRFW